VFSECGNFIAAILQQWGNNDVKVHYWVENVSSHIVKSNPSLELKDKCYKDLIYQSILVGDVVC